ncbi:hypothetical protein [Flavobacterium sp.]|uniref:hypothetical protein n=1 Tax=Flavobacterium sp. TaxID=239 RepID=UPI00374C8BEE
MEKVLNDKYSNYHKIWFSKKSTGVLSAEGPFKDCFNDTDFKDFYRNFKKTDIMTPVIIPINYKSIKTLTKCKNKAISIKVNNSISFGDFSFVYIQVYLKNNFVDHFLFKIKENKIDDYCFKSETI